LQQTRDISSLLIDAILVCIAGIFLGVIFNNNAYVGPPDQATCDVLPLEVLRKECMMPMSDPVTGIAMLSILALSLTAVASSLRVFGSERVNFWREASSGINTLSYFLGKDVSQIPNMLIAPLIFETLYYSLVAPRSPFLQLYSIFIVVQFSSVGIGYLVSVLVKPQVSQLTGVVTILVFMMFSGPKPPLPQLKTMPIPVPYVPYISFLRWGQEAVYITEVNQYRNVYNISTGLEVLGYSSDNYRMDLVMMLSLGIAFRIFAFIFMVILNRDKKK